MSEGSIVDALLIVDMQVGMLDGAPKLDLPGVVDRINRLAAAVRTRSGRVIWIQHSGPPRDAFALGSPGWDLLPDLHRESTDEVIGKSLNDPFAGSGLAAFLQRLAPDRLLICGWATDSCVDGAVRSAISADHDVVAVADAHTVSDRPHMDAAAVIRHHNWLWASLIPSRSVAVLSTDQLLA